jgi:CP family cyanate transporter-like MFS transporter
MKSDSPEMTRTLSTMMQSLGYIISAAGPIYVGTFFEATSSWNVALIAIAAISGLQLLVGLIVGKPHKLAD